MEAKSTFLPVVSGLELGQGKEKTTQFASALRVHGGMLAYSRQTWHCQVDKQNGFVPVSQEAPFNYEIVLFEPDMRVIWGMDLQSQVMKTSKHPSRKVDIAVVNTTKHDITLPRQIVIGTLQRVVACHQVPVPSGEKVTVAQVQDRSPLEPGPDNVT